jgi:hypothetical protein
MSSHTANRALLRRRMHASLIAASAGTTGTNARFDCVKAGILVTEHPWSDTGPQTA